MGFLITREPIFISLPLHHTLYTNILQINRFQKDHFQTKKQNFSQKICVIKNKVVSLHAKIKENG
jgi:hypothetical protein